ncbi:MAG: hypothetical protein INR72_17815, partial [Williamsia herbipolensis]|nr:hypothetical protein [Williamsia herbipolensis]
VGIGTGLLVALAAALIPSISASAAPPSGYVPLGDWTVGATATTQLPGNAAGLGDVELTNDSPGQSLIAGSGPFGIDGAVVPRLLPSDATVQAATACVNGQPVRRINTCATFSHTVTLPRPIVDPVVTVVMQGGAISSNSWCVDGWYDTAITAVNGTAPAAGIVVRAGGNTGSWELSGTALTIPQSTIDTAGCGTLYGGGIELRLRGLVSSFEMSDILREAVVANPNGSPVGAAPIGGLTLNLNVPSADLGLTSSTAPTVAPNGTATWDFTVTNGGPGASHGFLIRDAVPEGLTGAKLENAPAGCTFVGTDIQCVAPSSGCTIDGDADEPTWGELTCPSDAAAESTVLASGASLGPIRLSGIAPATVGSTLESAATLAGVDSDPAPDDNEADATTTVAVAAPATAAGATGVRGARVDAGGELVDPTSAMWTWIATGGLGALLLLGATGVVVRRRHAG